MRPTAPDGPVEVPETATVIELHAILSHMNAEWALRDPHKAMQVHIACRIGECIAKTIAWGELVRTGAVFPDSSPTMGRLS